MLLNMLKNELNRIHEDNRNVFFRKQPNVSTANNVTVTTARNLFVKVMLVILLIKTFCPLSLIIKPLLIIIK